MRTSFYYLLTILMSALIIILADFVLSNTVLNYKNCLKIEEFYYELKKNCKSKYRFKKSFPLVETITDKNGFRIGKNTPAKDKNKKNIFLFGDSFTYGVGIEFEKTYAGLISNHFKDFNVYNFAVGSYSPSVHLFKLNQILKKNIFPEKIILFLDLTDIIDEATRWDYDENNNVVKLKNNYIYQNSIKEQKFLKKNFKILNNIFSYINFSLRSFKEKIQTNYLNKQRKIKTSIQGNFTYTSLESLDKRFWKDDTFLRGIDILKKRLTKISNISKKNNAEFYLVVYPWSETLEFGQEKFNWSMFANNFCKNEKCKVIDLIPVFQNYRSKNINWSTDLYFLNDEHFNEKGAYLMYKTVINNLDK